MPPLQTPQPPWRQPLLRVASGWPPADPAGLRCLALLPPGRCLAALGRYSQALQLQLLLLLLAHQPEPQPLRKLQRAAGSLGSLLLLRLVLRRLVLLLLRLAQRVQVLLLQLGLVCRVLLLQPDPGFPALLPQQAPAATLVPLLAVPWPAASPAAPPYALCTPSSASG